MLVVAMVPCLLLRGADVSVFSSLMGCISIFNLTVKLNDMKENIETERNVNSNGNINLKIAMLWIGTYLDKKHVGHVSTSAINK